MLQYWNVNYTATSIDKEFVIKKNTKAVIGMFLRKCKGCVKSIVEFTFINDLHSNTSPVVDKLKEINPCLGLQNYFFLFL